MPAGKSAGKNMSARSVATLSGTTEATVSVPSVVILLVLAQATDGSSILSPGAASCSTTLNRTAPLATNRVFEIVGRRLGALVLRQEMSAGVGKQLIAPNRHGALFVDELEAVHAEVGSRRVAHWRRIPLGQERLRRWVRLLESLDC